MAVPATEAKHDYRLCGDEFCERFPCRVYKEGYRDGYAAGYAAGYAVGWADGYAQGFAEGSASNGG